MNKSVPIALPWRQEGRRIHGPDGFLMAEAADTTKAAFIVQCSNSHNALVEYFEASEATWINSEREDLTLEEEAAGQDRFTQAAAAVRAVLGRTEAS